MTRALGPIAVLVTAGCGVLIGIDDRRFDLGADVVDGGDGAAAVATPSGTPTPTSTPTTPPPTPGAEPASFCDKTDTKLILCLRFEGSIVDESSYAQRLDVGGSPAIVAGARGSGVAMTATTTIHVPQSAPWSFTELTVEMWVRPSKLPSGSRQGLMDKDSSFGFFVLSSSGEVECAMGGPQLRASALAVDRWTHLACKNGGGRTILYVDGKEVANQGAGGLSAGGSLTAVGGDSPNGAPFLGDIDSVRVFTRARSAAEIAAAAQR